MRLIKNACIITMNGNNIENGFIAFDSKICRIDKMENLDENGFEPDNITDVHGMYVIPGLIDAHCHIGIFGDSIGFEGEDGNEDCEPVTPALRAIDAVNPMDRCFAEAVSAGVCCVVTGPGSANPVGGQFAALKTYGICVDDMIIKAPAAIKFALGENPKSVYRGKNQSPVTRMGTAFIIREALFKAKEYMNELKMFEKDPGENDKPELDMNCEALIPLLEKKIKAKFHAHRGDDICTAIRIAKEFDLDYTIEHCTDAESVLPILERENSGICVGPTFTDRSKPELKSLSFGVYKKLENLTAAIITDHPETPVQYLPLCAAMAVRHGMDRKKALEAVTVNAAKLCGIDDRVGRIDKGFDADLVVCRSLPYEWDYKPYMTIINGKTVFTEK